MASIEGLTMPPLTGRDNKRMARLRAAIREAEARDPDDPRIASWVKELRARAEQAPRGSDGVIIRLKAPR